MMTLEDLKDEAKFDAYMEGVDADLRAQAIAIPHRSFRAYFRLQADTGSSLPFSDPWNDRVHTWFKEKYRALMTPPTRRRVLVMAGGDPRPMELPLVYGRVMLQLPDLLGVSIKFFQRLPPAEVDRLVELAKSILPALEALKPLPVELFDDWNNAIDSALAVPAAFGPSKWASAQTVEKVLGKFIRHKGGGAPPRPQGHELRPIAERAEQLGLPVVNRALLATVDTRPGARYRDPRNPVTAAEAVAANQAALFICAEIANHWLPIAAASGRVAPVAK